MQTLLYDAQNGFDSERRQVAATSDASVSDLSLTSYERHVTSCKLQATRCKLHVASYKLQVAGGGHERRLALGPARGEELRLAPRPVSGGAHGGDTRPDGGQRLTSLLRPTAKPTAQLRSVEVCSSVLCTRATCTCIHRSRQGAAPLPLSENRRGLVPGACHSARCARRITQRPGLF